MVKPILATVAVLMSAAPVAAQLNISRGDAFAIRSCPVEGDMTRGVCYNQETDWEFVGLQIPVSGQRERAIEIDCEGPVVRSIGKEFCPVRGELAPAPFLQ